MFRDVGVSCTRLNQRTARRLEEFATEGVASAMLGYLARASRDHVLVALPAALSVVGRPKAAFFSFNFFKDEPAIVERTEWHNIVPVDRVERRPLLSEAVSQVVKTGRSFSCVARVGHRSAAHKKKSGGTFVHNILARSESLLTWIFDAGLTFKGGSK